MLIAVFTNQWKREISAPISWPWNVKHLALARNLIVNPFFMHMAHHVTCNLYTKAIKYIMHFHEEISPKYKFTYKAPGAFSHDLSAPSISVVEGLPSFSILFGKSSVELSRPLSAFKVSSSSWSSKKQEHNASNPLHGHYFHITFNFM